MPIDWLTERFNNSLRHLDTHMPCLSMSLVGTSQADNVEYNLAIAVWWIAVAALDHDCLS